MACECGCGEATGGGLFRPGHDQRLRTQLEHRVGGLLALRSLVEIAELAAAGISPPEAIARQLREMLGAAKD